MDAKSRTGDRVVDNSVNFLEQSVKNFLKVRRAWDVIFKVLPPSSADQPYSVILEKQGRSERFCVPQREVARSVATGSDVYLTTDLRITVLRLEKRTRIKRNF